MKVILSILQLILVCKAFAIDKVSGTQVLDQCAVRISNEQIGTSEPGSGANFCSGTIIEDGTMLITAAHCLSQVFNDQANLLKDSSVDIAFPGDDSSQKLQLKKGQYTIFAGELLDTPKKREDYFESGDPKYIKDDVAIIKFATPLKDHQSCPILPAAADCVEFEKKLLEFGRGVNVQTDFFISNEMVRPGSFSHRVFAWFPSKTAVRVKASEVQFSPSSPEIKNDQAPLKLSFENESKDKVVLMRKGDSGSLLFWKNGSKNVAVGIQSATIMNEPSKAYFSNVCKQIKTEPFKDFTHQESTVEKSKPTANETLIKQ